VGSENFADCQLGDKRLNRRALEIGKALVVGWSSLIDFFQEENPETGV